MNANKIFWSRIEKRNFRHHIKSLQNRIWYYQTRSHNTDNPELLKHYRDMRAVREIQISILKFKMKTLLY